jgi:hypothetical protein
MAFGEPGHFFAFQKSQSEASIFPSLTKSILTIATHFFEKYP